MKVSIKSTPAILLASNAWSKWSNAGRFRIARAQ